MSPDLCQRAAAALPPGNRSEDPALLAAVLAEVVDRAQGALPEARVDVQDFVAFLLARVAEGSVVERSLPEMRTTDLYLAFASIVGDPAAIRHVERECIRPLREGLRRLRLEEEAISDTLQAAREEIFVGRNGGPALLGKYSGRGDLRSWVRVVVMRDALRARASAREIPTEEADLAAVVVESALDLDALAISTQARAAFREVFGEAVLALEPRERNLLRLNLVQGVSIDRLAQVYDVHRATAARWVERARAKLEAETLTRLQTRGVSEYESVVRLVWSQLDASVERLLAQA